ncbi:Anti-sigma-K factor rskA [Chitinophaga sp. CF118]|uniref:anti-sigma factor n=1 Tax=Chitinophaga sp. CF118 TaxID=1884367 RepID=UPI0008E6393D|nr:anti-sigma factor [Chitinophaga sp. CF118]SFE13791.1 Anti-sigma-K factor rskA [Chitinophaga sp. CF118]
MGASSYISSGLIEAYISGLAAPQELQELETAIVQYPEVASAVENCRLGMEHYIMLHSVPPPPVVKQNLIRIIADEEAGRLNRIETEETQIIEHNPVRKVFVSSSWRWAAVAASLLLLGSVLLNYIYFTKESEYKARYNTLLTTNNSLTSEENSYRSRLEQIKHSLDIVRNPSMKTVKMPGTKPFPTAMATVYWNQTSKEVFLLPNNLPTPAPDKQYQLWAIVDGKPVDMGVFSLTSNAEELLQKMKSIDNAQMFAITLENKGGSPVPTMEQMYVAGKAS